MFLSAFIRVHRRPKLRSSRLLIVAALLAAGGLHAQDRALVDRYCVTCHNEKAKTAGLALDKLDIARPGEHAEVWEKVVRKVRAGMMPPSGAPRPDRAALDAFAAGLEHELDRAAAAKPNPGITGLHRLNRTEYAREVKDLLALNTTILA